jgi:succinoglycan biosynthesis transport protein ExoP
MSTAAPTSRPVVPQSPRATSSGSAGAKPVQTIDPIKLLKKYFWLLIVAGVIGIALGVGSHLTLRKFLPSYDSVVTFKVLPTQVSSTEMATGENAAKEPLERFMSTQAQIMVSDKVLNKALSYPGYQVNAADWIAEFTDANGAVATTDAVRELQKTVSARPLPKSQFIQLSVSYSKAGDAAFIAQQITLAYMTELASDTDKMQDDLRETMTQSLTDLADSISLNERARDRIITENQLESLETRLTEAAIVMQQNVETLSIIQNNITSLISQQEEYQRVLSSPGGIIYPEDIRAQAEGDPRVQQTLSALQSLQASDRAMDKQDLGTKHPVRVSIQAQIDGLKEELEVTRESIMSSNFTGMLDQLRRGLLQLRAQEAQLLDDIDDAKLKLNELAKLQQEILELDRKIENFGERRDATQAALDEVIALSGMKNSDRVSIFQQAKIPDKMAFPDPKIIIPAGFVLFVGLVSGLIVLREMLDQRIKGPADVAMIPRTAVLGIIPIASEDPSRPERPETAFHDRPNGIMAESVRQLRVGIVKKMQQAGHRSLLVVPATPQSGATTLVTNLSEACARANLKTLVIDANLRRPRIHGLFNLEANPGLVDILAGASTIEDAVCSTDNPNLDVLTVGSGEHRMFERIVTTPMSELLTKLEARYDIVLIDTAPAIVAGDAVGLAQLCGATMLVARAMTEKRGTIARLKAELSDTRAEFLGVLINAVKPSAGGYLRKNYRTAHAYQQRGRKSAEA